jgi:DNA-binding LytR/AlgR family response regulator
MINCIIVDDDPVAANLVKHFVTNTAGLNLLEVLGSSVEAANYIRANQPSIDLIFLDIEMPQMSGLELLASFRDLPPVVLISSQEKYAARAFELDVVHYLLKPLEYSKFLKAVEKVLKTHQPVQTSTLDYLFVKENGVLTKVNFNDIFYFEALGDYIKVHVDSREYVVNSTMKNLEDKLKNKLQFVRVHRSFIANLNFLEKFDSETAIVSKKVIPIGNKYRAGLQTQLTIL